MKGIRAGHPTQCLVVSVASAMLGVGTAGCSGGAPGGGAAEGTPPSPAAFSADVGEGEVTLSWAPVAGAVSYTLYWSGVPGVDPDVHPSIPDVESPLTQAFPFAGSTYYLVVTATNEMGEGQPSTEIAVTLEGVPWAPTQLEATPGDASVELSWGPALGGQSYTLYWGTASGVGPGQGSVLPGVTSPHTLPGLDNGTTYYFTVAASNPFGEGPPAPEVEATPGQSVFGPYDPPWAGVEPAEVIHFAYDSGKTTQQNGDLLEDAMEGLSAGQKLVIGAGTYTVNPKITLNVQGTASAPVFIEAAPGEGVHITRDDQKQNTINIGEGFPTRYLALRGLEITWGDTAVRLYDCENVWIDDCHIHHFGGGGITANASDTDSIYITRNEIHDSGNINEGEGMYLGANYGAHVMTNSIVALNHVYDTAGKQGDGIELKQGSYGNWIAENLVHDTKYPCILVYGTDGMQPYNVIERNVCYNSQDNVMQIQGEAVVLNNLAVNGGYALFSNDHQGTSSNLRVVHNTFVNSGPAVSLNDWNGRPGMVFANNVAYSKNSLGLKLDGNTGVELAGNVVFGGAQNAPGSSYTAGNGLADFIGLSWDASAIDATPSPGGALPGSGELEYWTPLDLTGGVRDLPVDAGCRDAD